MPRSEPENRLRAALIDRLIDRHPGRRREVRPLRAQELAELRASVIRDLSWLLNTRTPLIGPEYDRRALTVIDYGIPDFGGISPESPADRKQMAKRIERAIAAFEPRLTDVSVTLASQMTGERALAATIRGRLVMEAVNEPVSFATIFELTTQTVRVHDNLDG